MKHLILILILSVTAMAQPPSQVFPIYEYSGGLKLDGDSAALAPNQCLLMQNMELDGAGRMVSRRGYTYLDSLKIANKEIANIFVYEPYSGTKRRIVACDSFIYVLPTLARMANVTWADYRLNHTSTAMNVVHDTNRVAVSANKWLYLKVFNGDRLSVTGDSSAKLYSVTAKITVDDTLTISPAYTGATASNATWKIYYHGGDRPQFAQYLNRLYIADPINNWASGWQHHAIYDDTTYWNLALIDSGTVSDTVTLIDTTALYVGGRVRIDENTNIVFGNSAADLDTLRIVGTDTSKYIQAGQTITIIGTYLSGRRHPLAQTDYRWVAIIDSVDTGNNRLLLDRDFPYANRDVWNNYSIGYMYPVCSFGVDYGIIDDGKNWLDIMEGESDQFLTSFYAVSGDSGYAEYKEIYCNDDSTFSVKGKFVIGDHYYIFSSLPDYFSTTDSARFFPQLDQILFMDNIMYTYGGDYTSATFHRLGRTKAENRVFYSDISYPQYMRWDYNFDAPEDITVEFTLRGNLYIASDGSISTYSGMPNLKASMGDGSLQTIIFNNGIPDIDNLAKATEEYAYFGNPNGIYRFNGIRAEKVSGNIDPVIDRYSEGRMVLGYFPAEQKLFVSFPDSDVTYYMDERYPQPTWIGPWGFGMTCFYAPPDTNIFYFGHSNATGRVYYWPNSKYNDDDSATGTGYSKAPTIAYESGWQSLGDFWNLKSVKAGAFDLHNLGNASILLYKDFGTSACDTATADSTKRFSYYKIFDNDCVGEYFKVRISCVAGTKVMIAGQRLFYDVEGVWEK